MSLNLYWNIASQPARAVKCLLNLAKIDHISHTMNLAENQTRTKEYLQMNPLGQIPFITNENFKLGESNAILVYLCQKYPHQAGKYYGNSLQERGKVNQHLSWYQNQFRPALFKIIYLKNYQGIKKGLPVYKQDLQTAEKDMEKAMEELQKQLKHSNSKYVAGHQLSIADLQYFFQITNYQCYEKNFDHFTLIKSWFERVLENEQVKQIHLQWLKVAPSVRNLLSSVKVIDKA